MLGSKNVEHLSKQVAGRSPAQRTRSSDDKWYVFIRRHNSTARIIDRCYFSATSCLGGGALCQSEQCKQCQAAKPPFSLLLVCLARRWQRARTKISDVMFRLCCFTMGGGGGGKCLPVNLSSSSFFMLSHWNRTVPVLDAVHVRFLVLKISFYLKQIFF